MFDEQGVDLVVQVQGIIKSGKEEVVAGDATASFFVIYEVSGLGEIAVFNDKFGIGENAIIAVADDEASDDGHGGDAGWNGDDGIGAAAVNDGIVVGGVGGVVGFGRQGDGFVKGEAFVVSAGADDDGIAGVGGVDGGLDGGVVVGYGNDGGAGLVRGVEEVE